ncbi:MAG: SH3 domain-containing protein [bacterium]|nr:SH3 domain-containing protein [bacterium]
MKKQTVFVLFFVFLFTVISFNSGHANYLHKYWDNTSFKVSTRMNVRKQATMKSKIIGVLRKGAVIKVVGKSESLQKINGRNGFWYKFNFKNKTGYVFGGYLTEYVPVKYRLNKKPFSILGTWAQYYDPPNETIYFYNNNTFKTILSRYNKKAIVTRGTYRYNGKNKINLSVKNKKRRRYRTIYVVNIKGTTTLKEKGFFYDPGFHGKINK